METVISEARRYNRRLSVWSVRCVNLQDIAAALDYGGIITDDNVNYTNYYRHFVAALANLQSSWGWRAGWMGLRKKSYAFF